MNSKVMILLDLRENLQFLVISAPHLQFGIM
jgi:hypothetical protein